MSFEAPTNFVGDHFPFSLLDTNQNYPFDMAYFCLPFLSFSATGFWPNFTNLKIKDPTGPGHSLLTRP